MLRWQAPKAISVVSYASLPFLLADHIAVAPSGEALVEGVPRQGMASLYLVHEDGSYIARADRVKATLPLWKRSLKAFRYSTR